MAGVVWDPDTKKPENAAELEKEIERVARGAQVKLTWSTDAWLVRALAPAAMCVRGPDLAGRDLSRTIAEILSDSECPAAVR